MTISFHQLVKPYTSAVGQEFEAKALMLPRDVREITCLGPVPYLELTGAQEPDSLAWIKLRSHLESAENIYWNSLPQPLITLFKSDDLKKKAEAEMCFLLVEKKSDLIVGRLECRFDYVSKFAVATDIWVHPGAQHALRGLLFDVLHQ
jgi:hypothetical protein